MVTLTTALIQRELGELSPVLMREVNGKLARLLELETQAK